MSSAQSVTKNSVLVQADKGKNTVIITHDAYSDEVQTFLAANNFPTLAKIPQTNTKHLCKKLYISTYLQINTK